MSSNCNISYDMLLIDIMYWIQKCIILYHHKLHCIIPFLTISVPVTPHLFMHLEEDPLFIVSHHCMQDHITSYQVRSAQFGKKYEIMAYYMIRNFHVIIRRHVISYHSTENCNTLEHITSLNITFNLSAFTASYHHSFSYRAKLHHMLVHQLRNIKSAVPN